MAGNWEEAERNPFTLPSDEEVFRMRDKERRKRSQDREQRKPVWQMTTATSRSGRSAQLNDLLAGDGEGAEDSSPSRRAQKNRALVTAAKSVLGQDRRQEKENMAEFIAKKREMFLVQMSLDTKREEIRKLEEKAQMKEEALKKSEQMLEEDAIRFDTFLKENDKKAHEAIKKAEKETKLKQDKVQEIKKLNQAIQVVQSDMSKHKEALEDCLKYKQFLDSLTPREFVEDQKLKKKERQATRRQERIDARIAAWEASKKRLAEEWAAKEQADIEALIKAGKSKKAAKAAGSRPPPKMPARPKVDEEPLTSSGQELDMYFTEPRQLLDIFTQLEEQNLFLIQNSQETEQALEVLRQDFSETQKNMDGKTWALNENIDELKVQIDEEEAKAQQLSKSIQISSGDLQGRQDDLLKRLHRKVSSVYQQCGFDASGGTPNTLFMLSELEARLEDLLTSIDKMPVEYVKKAENMKEVKRREKKRAQQQADQDRIQEERNRKSNERSMQPPKKRTGRQVMFRSAPIRRTIEEEKDNENQEDLDELKFLT
mmetsp:Transcript_9230/g.19522  ORF Transcript_9230/g.19522 Transcript_9230/m.19522 type:complete len:542 (-) Transcript_9230:246-1871(-)|eukprot:CAMPEP_0182540736 /NCGR_PEP_ID=MMETSP1323-20130603/27562_1 /TAXON_ID=236787 /ORGANISM="Florenciella parvula, Strain RCC1693" /LENGTH=541 /DNA_ID=CAMNT_0024751427 /DNA_START=125 /DNA_END=1750 /DNA_ORIENTATION=+